MLNKALTEHVKLMNRLVRAEALAASLEKQIFLVINIAKSKDIYANKKDSVTAALNTLNVDYTYKPDIEMSDRLRTALAQSLVLSADEIIKSSNLNVENLRKAIEMKTGPEITDSDARNLGNNFTKSLRAIRY